MTFSIFMVSLAISQDVLFAFAIGLVVGIIVFSLFKKITTPSFPIECKQDSHELGIAEGFIDNYKSKSDAISSTLAVRYGDYPKGWTLPHCLVETMREARSHAAYKGSAGIRLLYALKGGEGREEVRRVILFPVDTENKKFTADRIKTQHLIEVMLPVGFHDPCPPDCD